MTDRPDAAPLKDKPTIAELEAMIEDGAEPHLAPDGTVTVEHPEVHRLEDVLAPPPSDAAPVACSQCGGETYVVEITRCRNCENEFYTRDQSLAASRAAHPEDAPK